MNKFQIGEEVEITSLISNLITDSYTLGGVIGHKGVIREIHQDGFIKKGAGFTPSYWLYPICVGACWPEDCLELVTPRPIEVDITDELFEKAIKER